MKRKSYFAVLALLVLLMTSCLGLGGGTTRTPLLEDKDDISGRVVVNGASPDRRVAVRVRRNPGDGSTLGMVETNESGHYSIPRGIIGSNQRVDVSVYSLDTYSPDQVISEGLTTWSHVWSFAVQDGAMVLPTLDIYAHNMELRAPQSDEVVNLPYEVQFAEYEREVANKQYWLYFYGEHGQYGMTELFSTAPFWFDGSLTVATTSASGGLVPTYLSYGYVGGAAPGVLTEGLRALSAGTLPTGVPFEWFVAAIYDDGPFSVVINVWGQENIISF